MPLIKSPSKKALKQNIEAEMNSGKSQKQSLAIAFSTQRAARKKKSKGGSVSHEYKSEHAGHDAEMEKLQKHSRGGSIAESIMSRKAMADGGEVDLEENSEEQPNQLDELNMEAAGKELYDDEQIPPQPEGSNEHGDEELIHDLHDRIDRIRARMRKSGRGMMSK